MRHLRLLILALGVLSVVGCSPSTDVSTQPSEADLAKANERRAAENQKRTDLNPAQQAAMDKYYRGRTSGAGQNGRSR